MTDRWGTMAHTADLGLWAEAESLPGVFSTMCTALTQLMVEGPLTGETAFHVFSAQGQNPSELLVQLLNELVYLLDAEGLLVTRLEVEELSATRLKARLHTLLWAPGLHVPGDAVKAVTYHQALVKESGKGWRAQVLLDL